MINATRASKKSKKSKKKAKKTISILKYLLLHFLTDFKVTN
jgi:hypothetical protein